MESSRRQFLTRSTAVAATGLLSVAGVTSAAANRQPRIRGGIAKPNNRPAGDDIVHVAGPDFTRTETNRGGRFDATIADPGFYSVGYYNRAEDGKRIGDVARDGTPDVYTVGRHVRVEGGNVNLGRNLLPQAHLVNVDVVDEHGDPVEGATVDFAHLVDGTSFGIRERTNEDGAFQFDSLEQPGAELAGTIVIKVWPPDEDPTREDPTKETRIQVTEPTNRTFEI